MHRFRIQSTDFFTSQPILHSLPASPLQSTPNTPSAITPDPILRALLKAYNRKDLAGFKHAVDRFNEEFEVIRDSGEMAIWAGEVGGQVEGEKWREMVSSLGECCYQRTVGPGTTSLSE
jgi:hypothetical protein